MIDISMLKYEKSRILPYTPKQVFDLVADVESYPRFLPWCLRVKKLTKGKKSFLAEMEVGNNFFKETFISKDVLVSPTTRTPGKIEVFYKIGPFEYLNNHWIFHNYGMRRCKLVFFINIGMHKGLLGDMFSNVFFLAAEKLTLAFEMRARYLYSNS